MARCFYENRMLVISAYHALWHDAFSRIECYKFQLTTHYGTMLLRESNATNFSLPRTMARYFYENRKLLISAYHALWHDAFTRIECDYFQLTTHYGTMLLRESNASNFSLPRTMARCFYENRMLVISAYHALWHDAFTRIECDYFQLTTHYVTMLFRESNATNFSLPRTMARCFYENRMLVISAYQALWHDAFTGIECY